MFPSLAICQFSICWSFAILFGSAAVQYSKDINSTQYLQNRFNLCDKMVSRISSQPFFTSLPYELVQLIVEYLQKGEQNLCLSLSKQWLPLLHENRTICISPVIGSDYYPCPDMWRMFRDCDEKIMLVVDPVGVGNFVDGEDTRKLITRRKLTLSVSREEAEESLQVVLKHVLRFGSIHLSVFSPRSTEQLYPVVQLHNPTAASLTRVLLSQTTTNKYLDADLDHLHSFVEAEAQRILKDEDERLAEVSATSLLTLRGVRGLQLNSDGSVFLELGPDPDCYLQTVVLDRCHRVTDISALRGVSKVILNGCGRIADIQTLSKARCVEIRGCTMLNGVSALKDVEEVTLERVTLKSISELDKVKKLTVRNSSSIAKYPVPSIGKGQAWEFEEGSIADLSGWGCLDGLTLTNCSRVNNISMLGTVRYLTIKTNNSLILPKPTGRLQEWTFVNIGMESQEQLQLLGGLCRLMLHRCNFSKCNRTLSGLNNIEYLDCRELCNIDSIANLTNIRTLHVRSSYSHVTVASLDIVPNISLEGTVMLQLSETCQLKSLSLRRCKEADLNCLRECMQTLRTLHIRETTIDINFESMSEWRNLEVLSIVKCQNKHQHIRPTNNIVPSNAERSGYKLDNFTLHTAVDLWYVWEERARAIYGDINSWDVSRVTDMRGLFADQQYFNSDIGNWDVSKVENMSAMFHNACKFNQPLEAWDVSNVRDISSMFYNATLFNQPLADWDVSSVRDMSYCFKLASSFNQPLNTWKTSCVSDIFNMFEGASSFNQPLDSWDVSKVTNMSYMFERASSFNQLLNSWDVSKVTDTCFMFQQASSFNQPLDSWDVSNVKDMSFMFEEVTNFNQSLSSWNVNNVLKMASMFHKAVSFNGSIATWNVGNVTDMSSMFAEATSFNQPLDSWDVSNVRTMSCMFHKASSFNQTLLSWNIGQVYDLASMFASATSFDPAHASWDVSHVRWTTNMFQDA
jgi:surface protein